VRIAKEMREDIQDKTQKKRDAELAPAMTTEDLSNLSLHMT